MTRHTYDKEITALLVIDPYNDFISEGSKIWDRIRAVAEANDCVPHMLQVLNAARKAKLRVFYALHHRYRPGDYETWKYIAPVQKAAWVRKSFEYGTWGGEIRPESEPKPGEIVATEPWCSSGFVGRAGLGTGTLSHRVRHPARAELVDRGVEVSELFHDVGGATTPAGKAVSAARIRSDEVTPRSPRSAIRTATAGCSRRSPCDCPDAWTRRHDIHLVN